MRVDIQRKLPGFQELTPPKYRRVGFCVANLMQSKEVLAPSLAFKTKGILQQPSNTSLLQTGFPSQ